jgi:hypothetical protein
MRMKGSGLKKNPWCSWIEVGNKIHTFLARDNSHPQSYNAYQKLAQITEKLEMEGGHVPQTKLICFAQCRGRRESSDALWA